MKLLIVTFQNNKAGDIYLTLVFIVPRNVEAIIHNYFIHNQ